MSAPRFDASILYGHQVVLSNVMGRVQMGQVFALTPDEYRQLSDLAGALNYWAAQQPPQPELPVSVQPEIAYGDFGRKTFQAAQDTVMAFPFRIPAGPFTGPNGPLLRMSCAEYQGAPWTRKLAISAIPGDMTGQPQVVGKEAAVAFPATNYAPGELLYANILITEDATPGTMGSGFSIIWPQQ